MLAFFYVTSKSVLSGLQVETRIDVESLMRIKLVISRRPEGKAIQLITDRAINCSNPGPTKVALHDHAFQKKAIIRILSYQVSFSGYFVSTESFMIRFYIKYMVGMISAKRSSGSANQSNL